MKTHILGLASLLVTVGVSAQENQADAPQQSPTEQIRSGIEGILTPDESVAGASRVMTAEQSIADWKQKPKEAAKKLIDKYGEPDEVTARRLIWQNTGQFKRTEIVNQEVEHDFPIQHTDFLEQTIDFRVPPDKFDDLAKLDGSLIAERTRGELSARCDKEENNILALNLAQDVAKGTKTVEEAREFLTSIMEASLRGEKPAYMQSLQFDVAKTGTGDPDKMTITEEAAGAEQKEDNEK